MKKQITILSISLSLLTVGVNAQHHEGHKEHKMEPAKKAKTGQADPAFQQQLEKVYQASLDLNDAFVASDAQKVKSIVPKIEQAVANVDMELLTDQAHKNWMSYSKEINSSLAKIKKTGSIVEQREAFSTFNEALYKSIKAFGIGGETVYYQHCPMALNNTGASWLSDSKEIRNPYFGDMMLKCGSVKETL